VSYHVKQKAKLQYLYLMIKINQNNGSMRGW